MTRLSLGVTALLCGVLAVLPGVSGADVERRGRLAPGADPEQLLERARAASADTAFAGVVEVRWRDGGSLHVERVGARGRGGAYVVGRGDNVAVGAGAVRWAADDGVASRWGQIDGAAPPPPDAEWALTVDGVATIAGRPTHVVVARRGHGPIRARFFVDDRSGLLVRRDVLSQDGHVLRSVRYTRLAVDDVTPAVPSVPRQGTKTVLTHEVDSEFAVPSHIGTGFRLLGSYEHPGGVMQLFYSDGLFSISVFEQPGLVNWGSLPAGGHRSAVDEQRARWYATDAGNVVVWGRDGLALTGVSDAPPEVVHAAVDDVQRGGDDAWNDVVDFVLGPFGWD
jgi:hypothetical protein